MKKLVSPSNSVSPGGPPAPQVARSRSFAESPIRTRRGLWPLADGYLEANVLGGFLRGLMWFVGLFMAFVLVSGAQKVAQHKMDAGVIVQFIALQIPRITVFTIPSALLFGAVSTFTEMSSRGEITALMAGGMSLRRMLRAPLVGSVVLAVAVLWLQETIVPKCEFQRGQLAVSALQSAAASKISYVGKSANQKVERVIEADEFDAKNLTLTKPDVRINNKDGSSTHITAESARWDTARKEWVFVQGETSFEPSPGSDKKYYRNSFAEQSFKTEMSIDPGSLTKTARDLPSQLEDHNYEMVSIAELRTHRTQMIERVHRAQGQLASLQRQTVAPDDEKQHQKEVQYLQSKIAFLKGETRSATFGMHDKWATPLIVIAMVLVGAPLGVRPQRTASAGLALGLSLMVMLGYYIGWTLVSQWGKGGGSQPVVAAYIPFVVLTVLGTFLTWKKS